MINLEKLLSNTLMSMDIEEEVSVNTQALIAIAERLDRLCNLIQRGQNRDGTPKEAVKPL